MAPSEGEPGVTNIESTTVRVSPELAFAVAKDCDSRYLAIGMGRNKDDGVATYQSVGYFTEAKNRDVTVPRYDPNLVLTLAGEE